MFVVLVLCLSLAAPAFAAEGEFVPSITYKPSPEIIPVEDEEGNEFIGVITDEEGNTMDYVDHACLEVTPIAEVWDPEVDVPEEVEEELIFVFEALNSNSMEIPYDAFGADLDASNMVIRDLFDARWCCDEHREMVAAEGVTFEITFDLGVVADAEIYAATYDEATDTWEPVVKTVNNGDGTVTCTFEHLCPIAFSMVIPATQTAPAEEASAPSVLPWIVVLALAVVAVVVLLIAKKKRVAA